MARMDGSHTMPEIAQVEGCTQYILQRRVPGETIYEGLRFHRRIRDTVAAYNFLRPHRLGGPRKVITNIETGLGSEEAEVVRGHSYRTTVKSPRADGDT